MARQTTHGMSERAETLQTGRREDVARIAAFSDGVFAIAITLLTLQLSIPARAALGPALLDLVPSFIAFAISYAVIGKYWIGHHRLFALAVRSDSTLLWLNLLALFFVVLMPFTTSVIAEHGSQPLGVIVYAVSLALAGFAATGLSAYILIGDRMCAPSVSGAAARASLWRGVVVPAYFLISLLILLLPVSASAVPYSWLGMPLAQYLADLRLRGR